MECVGSLTEKLRIVSPKRTSRTQEGWGGFFPYYAGFPEVFARTLLDSANLPSGATILDPWNGSGTTTFAATQLGYVSHGIDLNPVMVAVARARLLPPSEADSLEPLAKEVTRASDAVYPSEREEPLETWFGRNTAAHIRGIETSIRRHLIGAMTIAPDGTHIERISSIAAAFYVALFSVCRQLVAPFQSSNPTWLRVPRDTERRIGSQRTWIVDRLIENLRSMAVALAARSEQPDLLGREPGKCEIKLGDTTTVDLDRSSVDLVLTSPPYCTRIDYTAATRIELAVLEPLVDASPTELSQRMIGTTRVPRQEVVPSDNWGDTCHTFLTAMQAHASKASTTYYYKTHLDYFDKMSRSLFNISTSLKKDGMAILVVQDSYYKDIHNDLPRIVSEMGECADLKLARRETFRLQRSMSGVNPHSRIYQRPSGATEAVLCFQKSTPTKHSRSP